MFFLINISRSPFRFVFLLLGFNFFLSCPEDLKNKLLYYFYVEWVVFTYNYNGDKCLQELEQVIFDKLVDEKIK